MLNQLKDSVFASFKRWWVSRLPTRESLVVAALLAVIFQGCYLAAFFVRSELLLRPSDAAMILETVWFVVGTKLVRLLQAQRQSSAFLDVFWNRSEGNKWPADRLEAIYARVSQFDGSPLARVFHAGYVSSRRSRPPSAARPPTTSRTSSGR